MQEYIIKSQIKFTIMLNLNVTLDLNKELKSVVFEEEATNLMLCEISISIRKEEDYNDLSFGYLIKKNGSLVEEIIKPGNNMKYLRNDQDFIEFYQLKYELERSEDQVDNYDIDFWCEESGERFEGSHSFSVSLPKNIEQ